MQQPKPKYDYERPPSLNEVERKLTIDRLNMENQLLFNRLKKVPPVIDKDKFKEDFDRHIEVGSHMRRKPMRSPGKKVKHPSSSSLFENSLSENFNNMSTTFDSSTYMSQQQSILLQSGGNMARNSPIRSMSEFRQQVISKNRMSQDKLSTNKINSSTMNGSGSYISLTAPPDNMYAQDANRASITLPPQGRSYTH